MLLLQLPHQGLAVVLEPPLHAAEDPAARRAPGSARGRAPSGAGAQGPGPRAQGPGPGAQGRSPGPSARSRAPHGPRGGLRQAHCEGRGRPGRPQKAPGKALRNPGQARRKAPGPVPKHGPNMSTRSPSMPCCKGVVRRASLADAPHKAGNSCSTFILGCSNCPNVLDFRNQTAWNAGFSKTCPRRNPPFGKPPLRAP